MADRREMQPRDWVDSVFFLLIGAILGSVAEGLSLLVTSSFWPVAVIILLVILGALLSEFLIDKLIDRIFPSGVRAVYEPEKKGRRPLILLLSFPLGFVLGVILSKLGLDGTIINFFS